MRNRKSCNRIKNNKPSPALQTSVVTAQFTQHLKILRSKPATKKTKQNWSKDQDKVRRTSTSRSRAACRPSNLSVYGCAGRIQTPLIPSVVSMSQGLLSLYIFWYAAGSISSYSFHDFLSLYGGCREKEAFDRRQSASLLSVLRPTALKTTPKNPDLTQIGT